MSAINRFMEATKDIPADAGISSLCWAATRSDGYNTCDIPVPDTATLGLCEEHWVEIAHG